MGAGNFAQVFDGQLRVGRFELPLAMKVQRTVALNREAYWAVEAKFDAERATHDRLMADRPSRDEYPIVEQIGWGPPGEQGPIKLVPMILCPYAKHALSPACPHCGSHLREDPWTADQNERALICGGCSARYGEAEESKTSILSATVRKDLACAGCDKSEAVCRQSADFFTFFPARILLFDRQELDLEQYLNESALPRDRRHPATFWQRRSTADSQLADLDERFRILTQALNGIKYLHLRNIAHLDVKPANFCLRVEAGQVRVTVIDLGLADDPNTVEYLQQAGSVMRLSTAFAPPEMKEQARRYLGLYTPTQPLGRFVLAKAPVDMNWNPAILAGDAVEVRVGGRNIGRGRIQLVLNEGRLLVIEWDSVPDQASEEQGEIVVRKQRGRTTDLYSFGMLILSVLTNEADPAAYQDSVGSWSKVLAALPARPTGTSELWAALRRDEVFSKLDRELSRYGLYRPYAEEAVRLALTLICRVADGQGPGHHRDRSQDPGPLLAELTNRWEILTAAFKDGSQLQAAERIREHIKKDVYPNLLSSLTGAEAKDGRMSSPATPQQNLTLEKALLEYARHRDGVAREQVVLHLRHLYSQKPANLVPHLRMLFDPQPVNPPPPLPEPLVLEPVQAIEPAHEEAIFDCLYLSLAQPLSAGKTAEWNQFFNEPSLRHRWQEAIALIGKSYLIYTKNLETIGDFVTRLDDHILDILRTKHKQAPYLEGHDFNLDRSLREDIDEVAAAGAVGKLANLDELSREVFQNLHGEVSAALGRLKELPPSLRRALGICREKMVQRIATLRKEHAAWAKGLEGRCADLEQFVGNVSKYCLRAWDQAANRKGFFEKMLATGPKQYAKVTVGFELVTHSTNPVGALTWLRERGLGPIIETYAGIVWEFRRAPDE